jgi:hypothetical protein
MNETPSKRMDDRLLRLKKLVDLSELVDKICLLYETACKVEQLLSVQKEVQAINSYLEFKVSSLLPKSSIHYKRTLYKSFNLLKQRLFVQTLDKESFEMLSSFHSPDYILGICRVKTPFLCLMEMHQVAFKYHFMSSKRTNALDKPYYLNHVLDIIAGSELDQLQMFMQDGCAIVEFAHAMNLLIRKKLERDAPVINSNEQLLDIMVNKVMEYEHELTSLVYSRTNIIVEQWNLAALLDIGSWIKSSKSYEDYPSFVQYYEATLRQMHLMPVDIRAKFKVQVLDKQVEQYRLEGNDFEEYFHDRVYLSLAQESQP